GASTPRPGIDRGGVELLKKERDVPRRRRRAGGVCASGTTGKSCAFAPRRQPFPGKRPRCHALRAALLHCKVTPCVTLCYQFVARMLALTTITTMQGSGPVDRKST